MDKSTNDPLRFVSRLFEVAVWPFHTVAKYQARRDPFSDQHGLPMLLMPAIFLFIPLCLLITLAAIVYTICVVPIVVLCQLVPRFAVPFMVFVVAVAVGSVVWGVSRGGTSFSLGLPELTLVGVVIVIVLGHQLPRLRRAMFQCS